MLDNCMNRLQTPIITRKRVNASIVVIGQAPLLRQIGHEKRIVSGRQPGVPLSAIFI